MDSPTTQTRHEVEATMLRAWMERGEAILIDVREPPEYATEPIPGARLLPLSTLSGAATAGGREESGPALCYGNALSTGGTEATRRRVYDRLQFPWWGAGVGKEAGYATAQSQRTPLSLPRQVQIVSGAVVLLGTVLGVVVSLWFLLLSGLVGAGLVYAGVCDTCGIALLLA